MPGRIPISSALAGALGPALAHLGWQRDVGFRRRVRSSRQRCAARQAFLTMSVKLSTCRIHVQHIAITLATGSAPIGLAVVNGVVKAPAKAGRGKHHMALHGARALHAACTVATLESRRDSRTALLAAAPSSTPDQACSERWISRCPCTSCTAPSVAADFDEIASIHNSAR